MKVQNYANHTRMHPIYHYVLTLIVFGALIGAIIEVVRTANLLTVVMLLIVIGLGITAALVRLYALKAQDRAIRAEENLRHYVLTGKLFDSKISMGQIVALRFASDEELPILANRAATDNLAPKEIKKAIQSWRADHNRI